LAYNPTEWTNREVEKPRTYTMQNNPDGTVTLVPAEGAIISAGTPIVAENMNKIEDQLVLADTHIARTNNPHAVTASQVGAYTTAQTDTAIRDYKHTQGVLWTGTSYWGGGITITPTKPLSQCRNGWAIYWSDYDDGVGANDINFYVSLVPRSHGALYSGKNTMFIVPCYVSSTEYRYVIKEGLVYDGYMTGNANNDLPNGHLTRDVCMRRVVEF
jgi:hypothetical protein